ncbi:hypothetical protein UA08_03885 [Talaromyces atroroseus]|uniref:3'-5' exonuclease domain-containing protein n=1 Tax=Talaromyces atroroseus TaxID=1441469 RepID=A0A225AKD3_TALAT|nr:hypothetical protein UA08_03885 [Talaromyces atroroseus]OKL61330.1 hypothetical protein UA08_03885 [Talaromyces atroroseus]
MSSSRTLSPSFTRFRQVLAPGAVVRRQFSSFSPLRGGGGFDDDDDFGSASSDISSMVRRRVNPVKQAASKAQRKKEEEQEKARLRMQKEAEEQARMASLDQRRLLIATILDDMEQELAPMLEEKRQYDERQRLAREERERAHKEWMKRYEEVVTRAASFNNIDERFFEEYYLLKYPEANIIDSYLDEISALVECYKAELESHRQAFRRINLAYRRIELDMRLASFAASLSSTARGLSDSVVTPQAMAKRKIDGLLNPVFRFQRHYTLLQNAGTMLHVGCTSIADDLMSLSIESQRAGKKRFYKRLFAKTRDIKNDVVWALHEYRRFRRLRQWFTPLGPSLIFNTLTNILNRSARQIIEASIGTQMESLVADKNYLTITWYMYHWYLPRWDEHPPRSINHNIDWKHLDVVHPFDLLYMTSRVIIYSATELREILRLRGHPKAVDFESWYKRATIITLNLHVEVNTLKYYAYLRLRTESRISSFGDVPDTISRGLFTPLKPLSSDPRRFFLYVDTIRCCMLSNDRLKRSISRLKAIKVPANAKSLPSPTIRGTQTVSTEKKGAEETTQESSQGMSTEKKASSSTSRPSVALKRRTAEPKSLRTRVRFLKSTAALRRGYSTNSRALLKHEQCETAEADVASTDSNTYLTENEDTIITTVSGTQVSEVISSHLSTNESDTSESPNAAFSRTGPQFWSYNQHKGPDGGNIIVHYCKTLDSAERVARLFLGSEVIGFDIEWKAQALSTSGIKSNVSLIQIANAERIALFHLAVFRPGNEVHELMPPSLKELLESASTIKVGVSIKADCSRVRRHLGIEVRGQLELSHLYKLVRFSQTQPKMVDRRTVNLSQQVEELLGLPLRKDNDVRRSDWTRPLDYTQVQYAASDAYACICLHRILDAKRRALSPVPPMPAYAELNLPILLVDDNDIDPSKNNPTSPPLEKSPKSPKPKEEEDKETNNTNLI